MKFKLLSVGLGEEIEIPEGWSVTNKSQAMHSEKSEYLILLTDKAVARAEKKAEGDFDASYKAAGW